MTRTSRLPVLPTLIALGLLLTGPRGATGAAQSCADDFEVLVTKVQENYAGYTLEVAGRRDAEHDALVERVRARAEAAGSVEECIYALREYTAWFRDPHLFIGQFPAYDSATLAAFAAAVERVPLFRADAVARLDDAADLDPIEGIWYDEATEIAVVPDTASGPGRFLGVVVSSSSNSWQAGEVKARITRTNDRSYRVVLLMDDRTPRYIEGEIYKDDLLLRLAPFAWGRRYPMRPRNEGLLHPADPRAPQLVVRSADAIVLSIPSHDPKYRPALEAMVEQHAAALDGAPLLIVDLRGNEGGSSGTTRVLAPYYHSAKRPDRSAPEASSEATSPVVLASPANLRAFERWKEWYDPDPEWLTTLLAELERRTGELVAFPGSRGTDRPPPDRISENPRRFAVLIDRGVVSAGEAFVLEVRRYDRVTVYGQPTGGSIDYQNVQMLRLADEERGFVVGYPTLAASATLPEGGHNATGILPDVEIGPEVEDPIGFILADACPVDSSRRHRRRERRSIESPSSHRKKNNHSAWAATIPGPFTMGRAWR